MTSPPSRVARFEVRRMVGEGAFGRVYEAYDPALRRVVALKVAKAEHMAGPRRVERFLREARAAAGLTHPHIVAVYDSGQDGASYYIASAFVPGQPLSEVLERRGGKGLELREAAIVVRKLAEALEYAHRMGVVHRDIKPSNVMLDEGGEPLLMDFGLAARTGETERLTVAGQFMGTPEYTAPEQWRGNAVAASDQYSLGCLLYEVLAGKPPFGGGSAEHYLLLHTQIAPPGLRALRGEVPRDLEAIALKCLEKDIARRYDDCQELADDLKRWLDGEPVLARPTGSLDRGWRRARRSAAVAGLAGALAMAVAGALVSGLWMVGPFSPRAKWGRDHVRGAGAETVETEPFDQASLLGQAAEALLENRGEVRARELLKLSPPALAETWEYRLVQGLSPRARPLAFRGHTGAVTSLAISPSDQILATGGEDKTVRVWDIATGQARVILRGHTRGVHSVAFSLSGKRLASASDDRTVRVWDIERGQQALQLRGHTDRVYNVAYRPDGARLASSGEDKTVRVWDVKTGQEVAPVKRHDGRVRALVYSPDGTHLASASTDGTRLASASTGGTVQVWDAVTGEVKLRIPGDHARGARCLAYSPDGALLASGSEDKTVRVYDAQTGQLKFTLQGHTGWVSGLAFSPDRKRIATGSSDGTLRVWDGVSGQQKLTFKGHTAAVTALAFRPGGTGLASGSEDGTVLLWDAPIPPG